MSHVTFRTDVLKSGIKFDLLAIILAAEAWNSDLEMRTGERQAPDESQSQSCGHTSVTANQPQSRLHNILLVKESLP